MNDTDGFRVVTGGRRRGAAPPANARVIRNPHSVRASPAAGSAPNTVSVYFAAMWDHAQYKRALLNYMIKDYAVDDHNKMVSVIANTIRSSFYETDHAIMKKVVAKLQVYGSYHGPSIKRSEERCKIVTRLLGDAVKITALLDIGCGDGSITAHVGKHFNIPQAETYGVDILSACAQPINYSNSTKNLADNSVDLVMAFVSLHHINEIIETLTEIYRVLRPGGAVIIREHDFDGTITMQSYLHLIHIFGDMKLGADCDVNAIVNGSHYKSRVVWDSLFEPQFIAKSYFAYDGNNPQALYHAMYVTRKQE